MSGSVHPLTKPWDRDRAVGERRPQIRRCRAVVAAEEEDRFGVARHLSTVGQHHRSGPPALRRSTRLPGASTMARPITTIGACSGEAFGLRSRSRPRLRLRPALPGQSARAGRRRVSRFQDLRGCCQHQSTSTKQRLRVSDLHPFRHRPLIAGSLIVALGGFGATATTVACIYLLGLAVVWLCPETRGQPLPQGLNRTGFRRRKRPNHIAPNRFGRFGRIRHARLTPRITALISAWRCDARSAQRRSRAGGDTEATGGLG